MIRKNVLRLAFALGILLSAALPVFADGGANHQVQNDNYGVSGGNINDITRRFCCSGTLGSLVQDSGGNLYILSNNHVLARVDQASPGEDISQPGLVDNNCVAPRIVADFTAAPPLGSDNVDAAVAALRSGTMRTDGFIEDVGVPSSVVEAPAVGLSVAKSGRTTGFTTGTISSINTSVRVQYQKKCGQGRKFTINYTNQVVITSTTFSAGGDSGSLIVSNSGTCHQPVALLFAGSSSTTIGNPIGDVLSALSSQTNSTISFVGGTCSNGPSEAIAGPDEAAIKAVASVLDGRRSELMAKRAVLGVGVGSLEKDPITAAIVVFVDKTQSAKARLPQMIDGVPVRIVSTEPFVAF